MDNLVYYDLLDTARTSDRSGSEEEITAQRIAVAQILRALLSGETIVLAQAQSFDSSVILGAGSDLNPGSEYFRWLVEKGHIRFHLLGHDSIVEAFRTSIAREGYVLSAWPEIETKIVEHRPVLEYLNGLKPSGLPDSLLQRLETLRALDSVHQNASHGGKASRSKLQLHQLVQAVCVNMQFLDQRVRVLLTTLSDKKLNDRSLYYRSIESKFALPADTDPNDKIAALPTDRLRLEAKEVVDLCYNAIMSSAVGADLAFVSSSLNESIEAVRAAVVPNAQEADIFESDLVDDLNQIGWHEVQSHLKDVASLPYTEKQRVAMADKLLARVRVGSHWQFRILPKTIRQLLSGLIWGLPSAAGVVAGLSLAANPALGAFVGGLVGFIPGFLSGQPEQKAEKWIEEKITTRVMKKYEGLFIPARKL